MSKDAVTFFPTSPRYKVALELRDTLECLELNDAYGISMERATDKKGKNHWSILFCRAKTVDGLIRVYSDRFIQITINQRAKMEKFTSVREAKCWLVREFAN